MKRLEEENNRLFIDAYGLADELTPDVPIEQITLTVNPAYRYGGKLTEEQQWTRFREDTMQELVSYAIGCMMGRYSLDAPGLIYAHSGNEGFDPSRYPTFPADEDGIVPLTDTEWFDDDASHRLIEFISVAWDKSHLEANLTFLADNLSPKKSESSRETIRRYLCDKFFKDHLQTYKKRPIYWLLLERQAEGVSVPGLPAPLQRRHPRAHAQRVRDPAAGQDGRPHRVPCRTTSRPPLPPPRASGSRRSETSSTSSSTSSLAFDEKLRHYADRRISLDLDDGVKVNYGKFGNLLAEFLVYSTGSVPPADEDWLLDIRLYSSEFRADVASIWLQELALASGPARPPEGESRFPRQPRAAPQAQALPHERRRRGRHRP
jgi:hypothetical protein